MKIVAHRGDCARFPENSLAAFEHAIRAGADLLETDVRIAADGVPVCWHDPDLARVTGTATPIAGTTAAGLAAIALPGDARVHRLEEILAIARGRRPLMLDLKVDDAPARAAIMRAVALADMADEVVLGVRTPEQAAAYAATGRPLALLAMPAEPEGLSGFSPRHLIGARLWEDQVHEAALARIRARQLPVWVTAGKRSQGEAPGFIDAARLRILSAAGIDAVLVNDVQLAVATRGKPAAYHDDPPAG